MIKKTFLYALGGMLIFTSCKKDDNAATTPDRDLAYVSFTNANSSSKTLTVFVDQKQVNATAIAVNATMNGVYGGFAAGDRALLVRDAAVTTPPPVDLYSGNIALEAGKAYSFFQYGVLTGGTLKGILLNTDNVPDKAGNAKVRFLNIANGSTAPAVDFVMVRREGSVEKDSIVLFSGLAPLASMSSPDIAALSPHKSIAGNRAANATPGVAVGTYNLKVKVAGSNTLIASSAGVTVVPGRNYTYYLRGTYPSVALSSVIDY